jgi:Uma2 family endonuclease
MTVAEETRIEVSTQDLRSVVGHVIAVDASLEDYMATYAADHCEWIEGFVIKMSPIQEKHDLLTYFLRQLLEAYFELRPIGTVRGAPFVLRLPAFPKRRREPDLMVVLDANRNRLTDTYMDGPADICIEVVSAESVERDYGNKLIEYEKGGVPEYWTIDPLRTQTSFYRLNSEGYYQRHTEDEHGHYRTPALPGFALHVPTLWQDKLPGPGATVETVRAMLAASQE